MRWKRGRIVFIAVWIIFSFLVLLSIPVHGQVKPEPVAEKIDIPNIVGILGVPYPAVTIVGSTSSVRMVCEVKVIHKDGSVYTEHTASPAINLESDIDTMLSVKWAYDTCRDRTMQILADLRAYVKNTVSVKALKHGSH